MEKLMSKVTDREYELKVAQGMLSRIGETQPHFRAGSVGTLHEVECKITIHHQRSTGDTNYHNCRDFDRAMAAVVSRRFSELSAEAIGVMKLRLDEAIVSEEDELKSRLESVALAKARLAEAAH
jgi:hypothetical protein